MLAVVAFGSALLAHLGISALLMWRYAVCTSAFSTMPSPQAFARSRDLAQRAVSEGGPLTAGNFLCFASSSHEVWSPRPWTMLFALGGALLWLLAVGVRFWSAPAWLP